MRPFADAVVVTVPAKDEEDTILDCLFAVERAVRHALDQRVVRAARVEVVAHRSSDRTQLFAEAFLRESGLGRSTASAAEEGVGSARDLAVRRGLSRVAAPPARCWVFSTDADTTVPVDWVSRALMLAAGSGAHCVVGLAELDHWHGDRAARAAYDAIIAAKLYDDPAGMSHHGHVYGANLAVRADAYLAVGGFDHHGHGEDQRLVDALAASGVPVLRTRELTVVTSGRLVGRADDGLAAVLGRLCVTDAMVSPA